jgi:hypothetical protein
VIAGLFAVALARVSRLTRLKDVGDIVRHFLFAVGFACAAGAAQAQPAPVEAYGRLPAIGDAAISADGRRVAMVVTPQDQALVSVVDLEQRAAIYSAAVEEDSTLHEVGWVDDQRVNFLLRSTFRPGAVLPAGMRYVGAPRRIDFYRHGIVDLGTMRSRLLTVNPADPWQDQGARLIAPIEGDPGYVRMIGRAPGLEMRRAALFRVSLNNGNARMVSPRGVNADTLDYLLDEHGEVIARLDSDERTNHWQVDVDRKSVV